MSARAEIRDDATNHDWLTRLDPSPFGKKINSVLKGENPDGSEIPFLRVVESPTTGSQIARSFLDVSDAMRIGLYADGSQVKGERLKNPKVSLMDIKFFHDLIRADVLVLSQKSKRGFDFILDDESLKGFSLEFFGKYPKTNMVMVQIYDPEGHPILTS